MRRMQTLYFIPSLGQDISDFMLQTVSMRRRRKVTRYLQHFDLWLRHTRYKSLSDSLLPLEAYVYFYLSHISLYPEPTNYWHYYLPVHIDDLLINRKLKGLGRLSNRQAVSRIAAAMNWQEHRFGKNLDPLRFQMKKLYRQAKCFVNTAAFTGLDPCKCLELVEDTCRGLGNWVRDLAMLRLLQETECTTSDLARTLCSDLIGEWFDEWQLQLSTDKRIFLADSTAMLLQVLLGRHYHLEKYTGGHQHMFSTGDVGVEFVMESHQIEIALERRIRFALMLKSVNCAPVVDLYCQCADPFPGGFVSERKVLRSLHDKPTKIINLQFSLNVDNGLEHAPTAAPDDQYFYVDWDDAIRNIRMSLAAEQRDSPSDTPNALENANQRNRLVFFTEEDSDEIPGTDGA